MIFILVVSLNLLLSENYALLQLRFYEMIFIQICLRAPPLKHFFNSVVAT